MTKETYIYGSPHVGCLLGTAFQAQYSKLASALESKGLELAVSEYLILRTLYDNDGMQQCDIASSLGKDQAAVCRCVKKMAERELVRTEPISRKCLRVFVADKGRAIETSVMEVASEVHAQLAAMLTPREMQELVRLLNKVKGNQ